MLNAPGLKDKTNFHKRFRIVLGYLMCRYHVKCLPIYGVFSASIFPVNVMVAYNFAYNFAGKIEIEREKTPYTSEYILRIPRLCGIYYENINLFVNSPFKGL